GHLRHRAGSGHPPADGWLRHRSWARGDYHRLPHGLPIEQQRLKATTASHALLAAGHNVHLDPTLNMLATPDGDRDAALRYLTQLAERASAAETSSAVAEVLTEVAATVPGPPPLTS